MRKISERQRQILRYVEEFIREHGYPPSIRQIQTTLGLSSTSVVDYNLKALQRQGLLHRERRSSRSITLNERGVSFLHNLRAVPLVGTIAAGEPIPVPEDPAALETLRMSEDTEWVQLPADLWPEPTDDLFALRVKGNSMIDAFIADGDIVILRHQQTAHNGEMVAVWLRDRQEVTLKRFYLEGEKVRLQPENREVEPIVVDARQVAIQGRVVGVIRRYERTSPP
ncbi:MAG: transcriptional repressor LexA [Chloroflexia bacterium]